MIMNSAIVICSKSNLYGKEKKLQNLPLLMSALKQLKVEESDSNLIILRSSIKRYIMTLVKNPCLLFNILILFLFKTSEYLVKIKKVKYLILLKQVDEWEKILLSSQPNLIIGIGLPRSLIIAAKLLNISSIEVQHGILTANNTKFYWNFPYKNLDCKPNVVLGWDNFFKDLVEDYGIRFTLLEEVWSLINSSQKNEENKQNILILLGYKTIFFIKFFTVNFELILYLRRVRKLGSREVFCVKLHPASYNIFNKILVRIYFRVIRIKVEYSKNLSLTEVIPYFSQILTSKSASVWEVWKSGKEVLHFGELPLDWYDKKIVNSPLFKNMSV